MKKIKAKTRIKTAPEVRKRQILDAARDLLVQEGYQDIQLDRVAMKAGVAKGTLYLYFTDKAQMMAAVFEDLMDILEKRLLNSKGAQGLALLEQTATINLDFLRENHDFFSQFMRVKESLTGKNKTLLHQRFEKHIHMIRDFIQTAVDRNEIPAHDPYLGSFYFVSLIRMFWVMESFMQRKKKENEIDDLMELFLHGIRGKRKVRASI